LLHAVKCGIERTFFHNEQLVGHAADMRHDSVPVHGFKLRESFEDEQIERALQVILCHRSLP